MVNNLSAARETRVLSLGQEDPLEEGMATTPVFLPGEPHGRRSLVGHSPRGCRESDMTECLTFSLSLLTLSGEKVLPLPSRLMKTLMSQYLPP